MKPPAFQYERPDTMAEVLALLSEYGDEARPLAGGQSLVPMLNLRLAAPGVVVDLNGLPGLDHLDAADGTLVVGALTRQRRLELSPEAAAIGALADGLPLLGHIATRNRGTVGGSVAHADPAAELPLALLTLGGSVAVEGPEGRREIPADDLFTGFLTTTLRPAELVTEVRFPVPRSREGSALLEVAQRHGDFPLAAVAVSLRLDADGRVGAARVAAGAVADRPLLLPGAAEALVSGATPEEAGRVVAVLVARAVTRAFSRARGDRPDPRPDRPAQPARSVRRTGRCTVNGRTVSLEGVPGRRLLSDFLRHDLGLRGTHVGCEHGVCGACTIRLDGAAVRSCLLLARQADGAEIATVEGLAAEDEERTLHPLQEAFRRHFALQCGFCTAGILMAASELLDTVASSGDASPPDEEEIRRLLSGHLCRCTGYEPIVAAIGDVAAREDPAS
jgi:xanthine dehydrogenase iron-sulfur cluster and FAD-binding subunit A